MWVLKIKMKGRLKMISQAKFFKGSVNYVKGFPKRAFVTSLKKIDSMCSLPEFSVVKKILRKLDVKA